jgi:triacylglycerol esterase/lipase EstA (alpha/beta hydrolase family)
MKTKVLAIHGAFSSPLIFNYLQQQTHSKVVWQFWNYAGRNDGLSAILDSFQDPQEPHHVVGHSMGGIMALSVWNKPWVQSISTISTPLGGLDVNVFQNMFSRSSFTQDIASHSDRIRQLAQLQTTLPVQHIISTQGFNPWLYEPNDGVVTLRSQRAFALGPTHDVTANHAEVMLSPQTVQLLLKFWKQ